MRTRIVPLVTALAATLFVSVATAQIAQTQATRNRALIPYKVGLEEMRAEEWEKAIRSFHKALEIDPEFEMAYYSIGRARMAQKRFEDAATALVKSRDLYQAQAGRHFANAQDAQRFRRDQIIEIDELIRQYRRLPQTMQVQDAIRQYENRKRDLQMSIDRGTNMTIQNTVPAYVSLSLGSAYFRLGRFDEAEREYKATVAADPTIGEAYSNLAVVYLEMGRIADAERSLAEAKKTGFRVNPLLEQDIRSRKKSGS